MKQKLFVLGLLLSFAVTGSMAWTGNDDTWWEQYGYSEAQQASWQTYNAVRDYDQGYATYVAQNTGSHVGTGLDLDWTAFDQAKNGIYEFFIANRSKLSEVQAIALEKVYNDAVAKERLTMALWYSAIYDETDYVMKTARFYTDIQDAWQPNIDAAAAELDDALTMAQGIAQANALLQEVQDHLDAGDEAFFFGKNSTGSQDLVWTSIEAAVNDLKTMLEDEDVKAFNPYGAYDPWTIQLAADDLASYLEENEAYKKDIDDEYDKLVKLNAQAGYVLDAVDGEGEYVLQEPYRDQLQKAKEKAEAAITAIDADQANRAYDKIEWEDVMNNDIALAYSELRAALSLSQIGQNQSNMLLDKTWTYTQPLPVGKVDGAPYDLNWDAFDDAQTALAGTATGLTELNAAAAEIAQEYADKKTAVETEWTTDAFNADQTTYTTPDQWAYNQTAWNNDIALDAEAMEFVSKVAAKVDELNNAYTAYQLADEKVLGAYAAQYGAAKTDVEAILNMDQAALKDLLLNANAETLANINNVRAKFLAAVNANQEEVDDVKTANSYLETMIAAAQNAADNMTGTSVNEQKAKADLEDAIKTAKEVADKVNVPEYNTFNNAKDIVDAAKALGAAFNEASNLYNSTATAVTPAKPEDYWVYTVPVYGLGKQSADKDTKFPLDWTEYEAVRKQLKDLSLTYDKDAQTAANNFAQAYSEKEGKAVEQYNNVQAWNGAGDFDKAGNWSFNQKTWQAGINADVETMKSILVFANALEDLAAQKDAAEKLNATDILKQYAKTIEDALKDANDVLTQYNPLTSLEEADKDAILKATINLNQALNANSEEKEDVDAAINLLKTNITAAQALIDKKMIADADVPTLQAAMATAQAIVDQWATPDYSALNNAADVTAAYMALTDVISNSQTGGSHAPEYSWNWTYSVPLNLGDEGTYTLDWDAYDTALRNLQALQATTNDPAFSAVVNDLQAGYVAKKTRANDTDWTTKQAWNGASGYASNWSYNAERWNLEIKQDAYIINQLVDLVKAGNQLYDLLNGDAKTLSESTKILGSYSKALEDAIKAAQTVYKNNITDGVSVSANAKGYNEPTFTDDPATTSDVTAIRTAELLDAYANLVAVIDANTEEQMDVTSAAELLENAIAAANDAAKMVEDVDGGTQYVTAINDYLNTTPNVTKLLANAKGQNYTETDFEVADAQTILEAVKNLNAFVAGQLQTYAGDITNINNVSTVEWAYAEPLRLGDNQDPAAQDPDGVTKYTLDWTKFDAALDELKNAEITAPEVKNIRDTYVVPSMETKEATAKEQWYNVPAWTGTNDKFVNQFQYNQTTWQDGINQDVAHMLNATKVLAELDKMYALNNKAEAHFNSEKMLQAAYLKKALKDALTASKKLYSDLTDGTVNVTEVKYAECEAAYEALEAAYNAAAVEEYRDVKTVQPLLLDAINEAKKVAETVEDVAPKTNKTNILDAAEEALNLLKQAVADDFDGDAEGKYVINYAKTLTDAIRDLNNKVRKNVTQYTTTIDNITPTDGWAYAQPLRIGKEKDPVEQDADHNTVYTLDWTAFDKALSELQKVTNNTTYEKLKTRAQNVVDAFTAKKATANNQWTSVEAWKGTNFKYVNQYQHNETTWNFGIANDAKTIANITDLVIAMDSLKSVVLYAKENLNPAADNANVVSSYAELLQKKFDDAMSVHVSYLNKLEKANATRYDVQVVDNATRDLAAVIAVNEEEKADIDDYRPLLYESYKVAQDVQKKIKDAAESKYFDALGDAIAEAKRVFDNANNHKYNEFKNAQEVTIARRALVLEMVKQQNAYADTISALKDTLQQTIEDARAASLVVNVNNTYSTDLQNEIAAAYGMMSGNALLLPTDNQDLNLTKLQTENARLKRIYCSAFILDLDSLKAAIADAEKFVNGIQPFIAFDGVKAVYDKVSENLVTVKEKLAKYEEVNARQTSPSDPYKPYFTDAATFNEYNTVTLPAYVDKVNKAHLKYNLQALKSVADSIQSYLDNQKVVVLYQNALGQVIDHATKVHDQYNAQIDNREVFNNFENQDKVTDAIVTAIADYLKFYAANDDAIAEAETVRAKLATKIADATTLKGELTDATSKNNLQTAITTATTLKDTDSASPEELTNGITALDLAMRTARWTDDIARLSNAIQTKEQERETLTDEDAKEIMALYINKAQALLAKLQTSVNTTVTTAEVSEMITELGKGLTQAQTYNNGEMLPDMLAKAKPYKDLIPTEYQEALDAQENSASLPYATVKAKGDALAEATAKAEAYTLAKNQLQTAIDEAKLAEEQSADYKKAVEDAETAVAAAFTQNQTDLTNVINTMDAAYNTLKTQMNGDRWSHQALGGKMIVKPWKANDPNPGQAQYIKLAGKYTSADAGVANNSVDLFITDIQGTAGTRTFDWAPFSAESDYAANIVNLTSVGVSDFNNFKKYGWSYDEHYNDIIIKAGAIYSTGDGFVNANHAYGPFTWTNVWNQNDLDILDKDADGNYYGRYYTYKWSETNEGGVYRVPAVLGIYDDTEDQFKVNGIKTYISKPNEDGSYYINSDLILDGDKGYDTEATVFNYENGTAILNGRWHRVQFIDRNQFLFHQAAQKAADWYNNNPDLRHYDTAALIELKKAVESDNNKWDIDAIEEAMKKVQDSYDKVNMILGDSLYGVIADGAYADVQRTYTVTGAPGDKIDAIIMAQTNNGWTKDDSQYWTIISNGDIIGADSTATITVKFNPGATYPADYREYQAILDVKVGNLNYQDEGKANLQQNLFGSNPKLSLKENELLQAHSLNLHRKDSITYDLYGRGYAHLYEKSPLTAKFYSETGLLLAESEVKTTLVKNQFTAYAADNDLDQTKFTVSYYPEDLGVDVVKVVISDTIRQADDIVLTVNAAKSQITFDPATVTDVNQNSIKLDKMADGTDSYFFPADGETYFFPIAISNFDGVNANTKVVNEDGVISITTDKMGADGLVEEHLRHDVQITIDNRDYFTVETATTEINGTSKNIFVISVKTNKLEQGTLDDGQHDGLLQIIWQDQDTIKIHLNQTLPWFDAPETATQVGPIVDSVVGNIEWEFTEDGDKIWYVDVNDVENYYSFNTNFGAYTNTDWFIVNPSINYQLTDKPGTRKYRLKITYNPHEVNTVYTDVLTLNIFDTKRNVIVATTSINLKGDGVASIKGNGGATAVENAEVVENAKKDGKYFKDGKLIIVKGNQEFDANGAQQK